MNWITTYKDLGKVKVGKRTKTVFNSLTELSIKSLEASCGCTKPNYDKKTKELIVMFTPAPIPTHKRQQGYYVSTKSITVTYTSGEVEVLKFKAHIY